MLVGWFAALRGQPLLVPADTLNKPRFIGVTATGLGLWGGSMAALQFVWYDDFEKTKFHTFDDSKEWGQMDKMGHLYTSFQVSGVVSDLYQWAGVRRKKAAIIGAAYSLGYMTTFEILDGYNSAWGFSWSDMGFNVLGTLTQTAQTYFSNDAYVNLKFSFHNSGLAGYRPAVLGNDFASRTLKDYNGQTYWLSFNPFTWFQSETKIPKWLNLSLGYSIEDQLLGDGGTYFITDGTNQQVFKPYRQCYLSFDVDFEQIPTQSKVLKLIFKGLNTIKVPFPALEYAQGKLQFRPFYF